MEEIHSAAADTHVDSGPAAVAAWFREISNGRSPSSAVSFAAHDDGSVWVTLDLSFTRIAGRKMEPIVLDFGDGRWMQAWSDGALLTLCAPETYLRAAVNVLSLWGAGVPDTAGWGGGEAVPDGASQAD